MAGKKTRDKGRRGESEAKRLLTEKDWEILADTTAGLSTGDLIAQSPDGLIYDVEVKNRVEIHVPHFVGQAMKSATRKSNAASANGPMAKMRAVPIMPAPAGR